MAKTIFIAGTDTEIGKTHIACGLVRCARKKGLRVAVFKPVAAGCEATPNGLRNADALALIEAAGADVDYELVNPCAYKQAIAPHLAAAVTGQVIDLERIGTAYRQLARNADLVVVEGAGGWAVPLGEDVSFPDLVERNQWPVLLVVGMRLGCLNHALLSAEAISRRTQMLGWVANCLPPEQPWLEQNIESLRARMPSPWLGSVSAFDSVQHALEFDQIYDALVRQL